VFHKEDCDI